VKIKFYVLWLNRNINARVLFCIKVKMHLNWKLRLLLLLQNKLLNVLKSKISFKEVLLLLDHVVDIILTSLLVDVQIVMATQTFNLLWDMINVKNHLVDLFLNRRPKDQLVPTSLQTRHRIGTSDS
jgi:hypothetical protein